MSYTIEPMDISQLDAYAALYAAVFRAEPWHEPWTQQQAAKRIAGMMQTPVFFGRAICRGNTLLGFLYGQLEQSFDGVHFQIQEFCILPAEQGSGCGTALLQAVCDALKAEDAVNIYLITSKGERTAGYYRRRGFAQSETFCVMQYPLNDAQGS